MEKRKINAKNDWLFFAAVLLAVLALCLILLLRKPDDAVIARIYCEDKLVAEVSLDKDTTFTLPDFPEVTFEVRDGAIRFLSSDCPDQICVHTGFLRTAGQFAVCLPYKLVLRVEGDGAPDAVTGCLGTEVRL